VLFIIVLLSIVFWPTDRKHWKKRGGRSRDREALGIFS